MPSDWTVSEVATGRRRYRPTTDRHHNPVLVLQVEVSLTGDCAGCAVSRTEWRNAQVTDLSLHQAPADELPIAAP